MIECVLSDLYSEMHFTAVAKQYRYATAPLRTSPLLYWCVLRRLSIKPQSHNLCSLTGQSFFFRRNELQITVISYLARLYSIQRNHSWFWFPFSELYWNSRRLWARIAINSNGLCDIMRDKIKNQHRFVYTAKGNRYYLGIEIMRCWANGRAIIW